MNTIKKISYLLFCIVALLSFVFAFLYLFSPQFMSYHAVAVKFEWNQISPEFQIFIIALMRTCGGGWLATGIAMAFILFVSYKKNAPWTKYALPLIGLSASIPSLIATLLVKFNTPAESPWIAAAAAIALCIIGFILSIFGKDEKKE